MIRFKLNTLKNFKKTAIAAGVLMLSVCAVPFINPAANSEAVDSLIEGEWYYEVLSDNTVKVNRYTGVGDASGNVVVPATMGGRTVTVIGGKTGCSYEGAFRQNDKILSVVVPATVTTIEERAFQDCTSLRQVTGLNSVTSVGYGAFENCNELTSLSVGIGGVVGDAAFKNCKSLTAVDVGASTTTIGSEAFAECTALTAVNFPAGISKIGKRAFSNCDSFTSATIPVTVTDLGEYVYEECDSITTAVINAGTDISEGLFCGCDNLSAVTINSQSIRKIGYNAFKDDYSLKAINVPSSVRTICESAFSGCSGLTNITLNFGLLTIENAAFYDVKSIKNIVIPNSVTKIGSNAFTGFNNIQSILVPNSVTSLEESSFGDAKSGYQVYDGSYAQKTYAKWNYQYTILPATPATAITFANNIVYLIGGDMVGLNYTITPANTTDAIVWESSYEPVATVNQFGEVTAGEKAGTATILATTTSGIRGQVKVVVSNPVKSISFNLSNKTMYVGESYTQAAIVKDKEGIRNDVKPNYSSSNAGIASVDSVTGTVKAISPGVVTISAYTGNLSAEYKITVAAKKGSSSSSTGKAIKKKTVSKKGKVLTVKTLKNAKVTVKAKKSILGKASKTVKANKKGIAKIKFKKKIKKVKVKVTIKKKGYKTFKKTFKF